MIVDDEEAARYGMRRALTTFGYNISEAGSAEAARALLKQHEPDLLLLDVNLPGMSGLDFLRELKTANGNAPLVIIITAHGSERMAVEAVKAGAYDYLSKPFELDDLRLVVKNAAETVQLRRENYSLRRRIEVERSQRGALIGASEAMQRVRSMIDKVAETDATVLVRGESGTGKELVARELHERNSVRRNSSFVAVNCAALPSELIESELFGHEKGAFTGAAAKREGKFEQADGGTLFLDEIGDLSAMTQAKLLRVLQEREFTRIGGVQAIKVDVRIVAATNKNLEELVRKGQFREDLYYRINVIALYLPPLRERGEDVPLLAKHFLSKRIEEDHRPSQDFSKEAIDLLARYPWPGNVREMENIIEQAFIWSKGSDVVTPEHLPTILRNDTRSSSLRDDTLAGRLSLEKAVMEFEREIILDALKKNNYVQTHAASQLGISRRMLKYRMDTLGIGRPDGESPPEPEPVAQE